MYISVVSKYLLQGNIRPTPTGRHIVKNLIKFLTYALPIVMEALTHFPFSVVMEFQRVEIRTFLSKQISEATEEQKENRTFGILDFISLSKNLQRHEIFK